MKISLVAASIKQPVKVAKKKSVSATAPTAFKAFVKSFGEPARMTDTKAAWSGVPCGGIIAFCKSKKMTMPKDELPTHVVMIFENSKVRVQIKKRSFVVMSK